MRLSANRGPIISFPLRPFATALLLLGSLWAEESPVQPVAAPVDLKAQIKELEAKQKPLREAALKLVSGPVS